MRPAGEPEQPDHYDHAHGCPVGVTVDFLRKKRRLQREKIKTLVEMINANARLTDHDIETCAADAVLITAYQWVIDVMEGRENYD